MDEWACYEAGAEVYASAGEDDPAWRGRWRERFAQRVGDGATVADIGCGPGYDLAGLAAMGLRTVGVDGSGAMLRIAGRTSPASVLVEQDLRRGLPGGMKVDGVWSMFALVHMPGEELLACLRAWKESIVPGGVVMIGLVESGVTGRRTVEGWLGQAGVSCVFHYHRRERVSEVMEEAGYVVEEVVGDTPACYRGGVYEELKLGAYVISGRRAR
jgi:SAM-dependent methyltransferase